MCPAGTIDSIFSVPMLVATSRAGIKSGRLDGPATILVDVIRNHADLIPAIPC